MWITRNKTEALEQKPVCLPVAVAVLRVLYSWLCLCLHSCFVVGSVAGVWCLWLFHLIYVVVLTLLPDASSHFLGRFVHFVPEQVLNELWQVLQLTAFPRKQVWTPSQESQLEFLQLP